MPANQIVLATNQVVIYGEYTRTEMKVGANATAAKMIPGALVILDTNEGEVKEAGAKAHGILGIIDVDATHKIGDNYEVAENIPILLPNEGTFVALIMLASEDLIQGDRLVSAANGLVAEQAVGAMGSQGDIVGLAWDTCSAASDTRIVVRWAYTPELAAAA